METEQPMATHDDILTLKLGQGRMFWGLIVAAVMFGGWLTKNQIEMVQAQSAISSISAKVTDLGAFKEESNGTLKEISTKVSGLKDDMVDLKADLRALRDRMGK